MNNYFYKSVRAIVYVTLVYTRAIGGVFYQSMDRMVNEVEYNAEMERRATRLKKRR